MYKDLAKAVFKLNLLLVLLLLLLLLCITSAKPF